MGVKGRPGPGPPWIHYCAYFGHMGLQLVSSLCEVCLQVHKAWTQAHVALIMNLQGH